ncbi:histidyl-tRNA synthetase [Desulfobaculum xiamenense]|uniref:Histidine--tRNA ligase n=1 Tax=Desulfobaculum xiamenense TaxID=995050 RepID=A0A846QRG4_9BACT|nr:histidine--tRNA ligase [Desulfobaculum xiamenense]NJB67965.1 histidyl-tRNA synthetase [Desulfobaculum xiamenense]
MSNIQKIKGVADLFPPESDKFAFMERTAREVFSRYGYNEVRIPIMEKTELFARSIGEETDVVQKEMYTFPDRKGRSLTLRPEATAGLMRAFIENKLYAAQNVSKLFTFGPMFRYERPQKGRMRQFHQLDVEMIGANEPQADAELLLMLYTYLRGLGLRQLSFEINSLGCRNCRPGHRQALVDFFAGLNRDELCDDCRRRVDTNPLRVLDCKVERCRELTANAPKITDHLCDDCRTSFEVILGILDAMKVEYVHNPRLVRGLDYYVGLTFEVTSTDIGAQTAVAGGGRYDGLISQLGGPDVPATGFAIGMERLALLLGDLEHPGVDFYVAVLDDSCATPALSLAQELRSAGLTGEAAFGAGSLKSRLRAANKVGARWCLLMGGNELAAGEVTVKDLAGGEQERVALSSVREYIESRK